ncbi:hypothetical protein [Mammaliicoccus sciuri]|uniref:hypothetical protein n=1 Tax=Mammaliicoccus sciuri TaxID=1296 RepID=UPI00177CAC60|nr:hypothetical protein [Mammaliicoccus sciuri]MCD8797412.1 hypothetical protein [Mammaliicoccus sciuri]
MTEKQIKHQPPIKVDVVNLIKVVCLKGDGSKLDPIRNVERYYNFEGSLLFEFDDYEVNSVASSTASS